MRNAEMLFRRLSLALATVLVLLIGAALTKPLGFLKAVTIKEGPELPALSDTSRYFKIEPFLKAIPYAENPAQVLSIHPEERYRKTVLEGQGDCSQMTKGMAYYLAQSGIDYQIIHIMEGRRMLNGWGHTVMRMPVMLQTGRRIALVDVWDGGLLTINGGLARFEDLLHAEPDAIKVRKDGPSRWDAESTRYRKLLKHKVLGYTLGKDMNNYFRWIEKIYVPLGHPKLEYGFYTLFSLILGIYPPTYVDSLEAVFTPENMQERSLWLACMAGIRLSLLLLGLSLLSWLSILLRRRSRKVPAVA